MKNQFADGCYWCGEMVEVGTGFFERVRGQRAPGEPKWRTLHPWCCHEQRRVKQAAKLLGCTVDEARGLSRRKDRWDLSDT